MTSHELTTAIFFRLKKTWLYILTGTIICGAGLVFYALQQPVTFTSSASIFPLTSTSENTSSSMLSALMGNNQNSINFSEDASINIVELSQSRTTREEVAAIKVPEMGNKTIAELLVKDINDHRSFLEPEIIKPTNEYALITWAGNILKEGLSATINKNNSFVLTYTGRSPEMVRVISYGFIDKISTFYIDLKREKARRDFEFATSKVDSLRSVMNSKDQKLIELDKTTMFTNTGKLEFRVPTENLIADKQMIRAQYANAIANQQNAAYKLQKATPVIKVLDKPEPPYKKESKSPVVYGIIGLLLGLILFAGLLVSGILLRFIKEETSKAIFGTPSAKNTNTTVGTL